MKKIALFFSALLFSMMSFAGLGEGYSKVTDIATLSAGDKVVLYCDDAELGVTGWDGNKTATAAAAGWVEYVVEAADGGVLLKDGEQYISLTVKNTFKYDATGSVCNVNASGVLYCTLSDVDYFLYENANNGNPVYRMYADKTGNAQYKPFYVYTVGEGGGETPDQPEEPETPETPDTPTEPELPDTPEGVITCAQAMAICQATGETSTTETYTIRGYVTEIKTAYSEQYGNISLWLADTPDGGKVLQAFRVKPVTATDINVAAGDFVEVVGTLVNYMGNTPEVNAGGSYTIITAGEGGETPDTPDTPEEPETPVGSLEGYSKVTDAASLVAGDKVVLYCDASQVGITGWDGNKTATAAASGWVEYVVELADGGFLLKDGDQYVALTVKNAFHYTATGSVCKVTADGILYITLEADGKDYLLYENANNGNPLYRMYVDKTGNSQYNPFYVYKAGAGSGETPDTPDTPDTPETEVTISDLAYAMAFYEEEDGFAYWEIQLFNLDATGENVELPLALLAIEAKSKTALNGTYDMLLALYGTGEDAEGYIDGVYMNEDAGGTITIKNVDAEGTYSFVGSFVGEDGKTYKINTESYMMWVEDGATGDAIELSENGGTDNSGDNPGNNPDTPVGGEVIFDADVDKGNAGTDSNNATAYQVSKEGVTLEVSSGILGTYANELHYRVYKNQTLTLTSTVGNIVKVEFTCTANDDQKYGPGCFTADSGEYTYSGPVGTWAGSASTITFTATTNQVRATQVVVEIAGTTTDVEDIITVEIPVKVLNNGQLMIISGENTYNILGSQIK